MKKFLLRTSLFALYALILQAAFSIMLDPFNVFHVMNIRDNGVEPNQNYVKMKYILVNPEKFNAFMFGSSRVGAIHTDKIHGERVYNMTYSVGLPSEHLNNMKTFLANNIIPSKIYIGVDDISSTERKEAHVNQPLRCPYEDLHDDVIHFCSLYVFSSAAAESINTIINYSPSEANKKNVARYLYKYGWWCDYGMKTNFDWSRVRFVPSFESRSSSSINTNKKLINEVLNYIKEIADLCRENNIKLVIFTNPMHYITYMNSLDNNYLNFLEGLADITDFYNFSSLNDITLDNNNYFETSHYKPETGDLLINIMCSGVNYPELQAQGFGVKVTRDNIHELINMLSTQAEDFKAKFNSEP